MPTLRAKGTLISEPRFSTPCEMQFFPREKGKTAFSKKNPRQSPFSLSRVGKTASRRGVENRGSLISVPLALRVIHGFHFTVSPSIIHGLCAIFASNSRHLCAFFGLLLTPSRQPLLRHPLSSRFALHGLRAFERRAYNCKSIVIEMGGGIATVFTSIGVIGKHFNQSLVHTGVWRGFLKSPSNPQTAERRKSLKRAPFIFCAKLWYAPNPGSKEISGHRAHTKGVMR